MLYSQEVIMTSENGFRGVKSSKLTLLIKRHWGLYVIFFCVNSCRRWVSESAPAGEVQPCSISTITCTWSTCDNRNGLHGKILEVNYFGSYSMTSLCMMDNPGEWAVRQEFFSTDEASDCSRTCIRYSLQKYYLRLDFQLFALWKEDLSHLQLSHIQQVTVSPGRKKHGQLLLLLSNVL